MALNDKTSNYREDFPGYQGHIPYKLEVIGKTVGATNETIKQLLTTEPPKTTLLKPMDQTDFSQYDRDYYCDNFCRDYPLEEDKIFSNKSKDAETWINGDKYKIYPQHIPGVKCHVPGIYSSNIYGLGYSKSTAVSVKGNYNKKPDCPNDVRFTTSKMDEFKKPQTKPREQEKQMAKTQVYFNPMDSHFPVTKKNNHDLRRIYRSKIAQVPTPGYGGHTSVFQKPISYLNYDKILEREKKEEEIVRVMGDDLPIGFQNSLHVVKEDANLPYVVGYKGFRVGIKARNYHGENFHDASLEARNEAKLLKQL